MFDQLGFANEVLSRVEDGVQALRDLIDVLRADGGHESVPHPHQHGAAGQFPFVIDGMDHGGLGAVALRPRPEGIHPSDGDFALVGQHPQQVRGLR